MASSVQGKKISRKATKRYFTTVGLVLLLYVLFVMVFPYGVKTYFDASHSSILNDEYLYYGIYLLILVFGTLIPFFLLRKASRIKLRRVFRSANISFSDMFVGTIVLFTVCVALTYVSTNIVQYSSFEAKLLASIGFDYTEKNLSNNLYLFMMLAVAPILEEYAFRGVLLTSLSRYGRRFGLYAVSVIYALAHNNFAEMIPAFAMSYILGKMALRYRSIQPTILIHILFNSFMYGLCVLPAGVTKYMTYGLVAICVLALYLILSGRYQFIKIQRSTSNKAINSLFYSNFVVVLSMMLMVGYTILFSIA